MSTADRYIRVVEIASPTATQRWEVRNIRTNEVCGVIKWYGGFRGYAFYPSDGFLFDASCLLAVAAHLNLQNGMRRAQKGARVAAKRATQVDTCGDCGHPAMNHCTPACVHADRGCHHGGCKCKMTVS